MKKILCMMIGLCSALLLQAAKVNKEVTIKVGSDTRKYWLYVPTNVKENCPFVLSLHGAGGHDTDKSPFRTDVADKVGCIVAYPQGKITVKIEKLTGKKNAVLNATVDVGEDATLPFEVTDGWGEYKITFTRPSSSDAITVTDLAIHSLTDEEVTKVGSITMLNLSVDGNSRIYDISGNQHSHPVKGINIINNKKVIVNRK